MTRTSVSIRTYTAQGFGENAYLAGAPGGDRMVAVDPGGEAAGMAADLEREGQALEAILLTHAHLDHVEGVAELAGRTGAPIYLHSGDLGLYHAVSEQARAFGMHVEPPPPVDHELQDGQRLDLAGLHFEVRHVPGHSPGHVLLYCADAGFAFVGDVVFAGSIGRTDLPGGSYQQLMRSIREQVLTLPLDTTLYAGHGPATTVEREAKTNPFLIPHFGGGRLV